MNIHASIITKFRRFSKHSNMVDLSCNYLGLRLKNPIIVGSSGLTSSIESIKSIAKAGAGAVILKSIFEEQIRYDTDQYMSSNDESAKEWRNTFLDIINKDEFYYEEAYEYFSNYAREHTLQNYLNLVTEAKKAIDIPVIASIHCSTDYNWQYFAKRIQEAGADALELNVYLLPSNFQLEGLELEKTYFGIIEKVKEFVTIPVSLKIGYYFSSLANTVLKLSNTGIAGLTLFNRPYNPDINIETLEMSASRVFSTNEEYANTLRWVAILSGKIGCQIAASTGIHNAETVIKQLLAGADVVQMVSVFYEKKYGIIPTMLASIEDWMERHNFKTIDDFRGLMSHNKVKNPGSFERVQFIRLYTSVI